VLITLATRASEASPEASARSARDVKAVCAATAERAQDAREARRWLHAKRLLLTCAAAECPSVVRADCARWLDEVERELPSVVLGARDSNGHELTRIRVRSGAAEIATRLDGAPISLDPGEHELVFEDPEGNVAVQRVVLRAGEKHRAVTVVLGRRGAEERAPESAPGRGGTIALFALSAAGLATFVAAGSYGSREASRLREACEGHCARSDVSRTRRYLIVADAGLVVALATAAWGGVRLATRPGEAKRGTVARVAAQPPLPTRRDWDGGWAVRF
jgi:hypothetical protein